MPRKAKPKPYSAGQPNGQPKRAATGQPYGERKAQMDAQAVVPLHEAPPVPVMERAIAEAQPIPFEMGGFAAPTAMPDEPVTAGLASGPGPGPEALAMNRGNTRTSETLALIASITGDPMFTQLAERARRRGL